jgi:hypothetical protein
MAVPSLSEWASVRLPWSPSPQARQISPNKNMNCRCTTAAFTLSPVPGRLRHLVLTRPETEPSMRFLSVGSHLCARASSRQVLAGLPCRRLVVIFVHIMDITDTPTGDFHPMSSCSCRTYTSASSGRAGKTRAAEAQRWAPRRKGE